MGGGGAAVMGTAGCPELILRHPLCVHSRRPHLGGSGLGHWGNYWGCCGKSEGSVNHYRSGNVQHRGVCGWGSEVAVRPLEKEGASSEWSVLHLVKRSIHCLFPTQHVPPLCFFRVTEPAREMFSCEPHPPLPRPAPYCAARTFPCVPTARSVSSLWPASSFTCWTAGPTAEVSPGGMGGGGRGRRGGLLLPGCRLAYSGGGELWVESR